MLDDIYIIIDGINPIISVDRYKRINEVCSTDITTVITRHHIPVSIKHIQLALVSIPKQPI